MLKKPYRLGKGDIFQVKMEEKGVQYNEVSRTSIFTDDNADEQMKKLFHEFLILNRLKDPNVVSYKYLIREYYKEQKEHRVNLISEWIEGYNIE